MKQIIREDEIAKVTEMLKKGYQLRDIAKATHMTVTEIVGITDRTNKIKKTINSIAIRF